MNRNRFYLLQEETGADGGAGAAGVDPGAAAGAAGSVLAAGAAAGGDPAGAAAGDVNAWIPEKFQVKKEDGSVDVEASAKKIEEHRSNLEKRLGSGDAPPKTPEEYAPELKVEGFEWDDVKADPTTQEFVKEAHAAGLNNAQLSFVMNQWFTRMPQLMQGNAALTEDQAKADLAGEWKSDADFNLNVSNAYRAFDAFAAPGDRDRIDEVGNNPIVIRLLANIGKSMQEDNSTGGMGSGGGESIDTLLASEAYQNPKHADHAATSEKVRSHFAKKYGKGASL